MPLIHLDEYQSDIAPGVYPVTLIDIRPDVLSTNDRGDQNVFRWKFIVDDGTEDGVEHEALSSQITSPRSKLYAWLGALLGEDAVKVGMDFEKKDLVGREAQAQFQLDEKGYPKLIALVAKPKTRAARVAAETEAETEAIPF